MAKNKFYAVKQGRNIGVFTTWSECEAQVKGFAGAEYKSFASKQDAENFINGVSASVQTETKPATLTEELPDAYAFVDGSFNVDTNVYGYGGFVVANGKKYPIKGSGNNEEMATMRNVAGEISGAVRAVKIAEQLKLSEIVIYYDYNGIEAWVTGSWKANKTYTARYKAFMTSPERTVKITFKHVKGHSGIEGNEIADVMAKSAVGISLTESQKTLIANIVK